MTKHVIIGGGVIGVTAARKLAGQVSEHGSGHEINILSAEPHPFGWYTDLERGLYRKFVLRDDRVVGAILLNDPPRAGLACQLIDRGVDVSEHRDRLVHDDFDLKSLL